MTQLNVSMVQPVKGETVDTVSCLLRVHVTRFDTWRSDIGASP